MLNKDRALSLFLDFKEPMRTLEGFVSLREAANPTAAPIGIQFRKPKNVKKPPIRTFFGVPLSFPSFRRGFDSVYTHLNFENINLRIFAVIDWNYAA